MTDLLINCLIESFPPFCAAVQNERQPRNTATIRPESLSEMESERLLRDGVAATVAAVGVYPQPHRVHHLLADAAARTKIERDHEHKEGKGNPSSLPPIFPSLFKYLFQLSLCPFFFLPFEILLLLFVFVYSVFLFVDSALSARSRDNVPKSIHQEFMKFNIN